MAGRAGQKIKLTSIDELLCVPETEGMVLCQDLVQIKMRSSAC